MMCLAESGWTATGMFWITVVMVLTVIATACINWSLYRLQIDPHVIVYAKPDESRPTIILLVIENIGKGLARDVAFSLSEDIPGRAFGVTVTEAKDADTMTSGPLIKGIPALGPGTSRVLVWGQYGGLVKALGNRLVYVTCTFKNGRGRSCEPVECVLEVRSFHGVDIVDADGARQAATQLKRIADDLHDASTGFRLLATKVSVPPKQAGWPTSSGGGGADDAESSSC